VDDNGSCRCQTMEVSATMGKSRSGRVPSRARLHLRKSTEAVENRELTSRIWEFDHGVEIASYCMLVARVNITVVASTARLGWSRRLL
jgi:hypothetical protein